MMRRLICFACTVAMALVLLCTPAAAQELNMLDLDSEPTIGTSSAAAVMDEFGNVLFSYNGDVELPLASITKVMTAMVALDSGIPLDQELEFVYEEYPEGSQLAGYQIGDVVTFGELLRVTLIYSANDAATNVAYAVAGSKEAFADLMNQKATEIGMEHTHFTNPHGLEEEGHHSTALDLLVMGRYAMEHYPFIRETVHTPSITIVANGQPVTLESTDHLMGTYEGLLGIKTGNTESGASFLGAACRNNVMLYSCVLCRDDSWGRFEDTASLLDWAYGLYEQKALARSNWILRVAPWQDGFWLRCPVSAQRDVTGYVFPDQRVSYTTVQYKPNSLVAANSTYGTTLWEQGERSVGSVAYQTSRPQQSAAWNPIALPLFAA